MTLEVQKKNEDLWEKLFKEEKIALIRFIGSSICKLEETYKPNSDLYRLIDEYFKANFDKIREITESIKNYESILANLPGDNATKHTEEGVDYKCISYFKARVHGMETMLGLQKQCLTYGGIVVEEEEGCA